MSAAMWIDSHCHLDAPELDSDRTAMLESARLAGVRAIVVPAVEAANFEAVRVLAHGASRPGFDVFYALGIHPMYVKGALEQDLIRLREHLLAHRDDPRLVAVGEIGLDGFVADPDPQRMLSFFQAQLRLASDFNLPAILHVRKAQDSVLRELRKARLQSGIAHAFNGSPQQATQFLNLGFCLGFGGAATYTRALNLRRLLQNLPDEAIVVETDSPDIAPEWLTSGRLIGEDRLEGAVNTPAELPRIGATLATVRGIPAEAFSQITCSNLERVLPRVKARLSLAAPLASGT